MDPFDAAEIIKAAWLERASGASGREMVLAACPYCGKADRLVRLEPGAVGSGPETAAAWEALARPGQGVGLCGFCLNLVLLRGGTALPLGD